MSHAHPQPDPGSNPVIQDFIRLVESKSSPGVLGTENWIKSSFVRQKVLKDYFEDDERAESLLQAAFGDKDPPVTPEEIRGKHTVGFTILLFIGKGEFIREFLRFSSLRDAYLPFLERPGRFPTATNDEDFWKKFSKQQWQFCPHTFDVRDHNAVVEEECVLPIILHERIGDGGSAVAHRVKLDPSYDQLAALTDYRRTNRWANTYVLKTYSTPDAKSYYDSEVDAFRRLLPTGSPGESMIGYYGSFIQGNTYNVILEFADRGTLEQYFQNTEPPTSEEDIFMFWSRLFNVIKALVCLHNIKRGGVNGPSIFQGWHQDVKPSNILVSNGESQSAYDCHFKLADLGLSHFRKTQGVAPVADKDSSGTRIYGAPECYRMDDFVENAELDVKQTVDIWSLGCVLSEAAVWLVSGKARLEKYRQLRHHETKQIYKFRDGGCFHDGEKVLIAVQSEHDKVFEEARTSDHVSKAVVRVMLNEMLNNTDYRPTAKQSWGKAEQILFDAKKNLQSKMNIRRSETDQPRPEPPTLPPSLPHQTSDPTVHQQGLDDRDAGTEGSGSRRRLTGISLHTRHMSPDSIGSSQVGSPNPEVTPPSSPRSTAGRYKHYHARSQSGIVENGDDDSPPETPSMKRESVVNQSQRGVGLGFDALGQTTSGKTKNRPFRHLIAANVTTNLTNQSSNGAEQLPHLSIDELAQYIRDHKDKKWGISLNGQYLMAQLRMRDAVFLIDDAESMRAHWKKLDKVFSALAWVLKSCDPDKLELYFTMNPGMYKFKHRQDIMTQLVARKPRTDSGTSDISARLGTILGQYQTDLHQSTKKRRSMVGGLFKDKRPLTVYIFTDACWQSKCDPAPLIRTLVNNLLELTPENPTQVGIQFIQFGNDPVLTERLELLDSGLGLGLDIVDAESADGNAWKMMLGSINKTLDNDPNNTPLSP